MSALAFPTSHFSDYSDGHNSLASIPSRSDDYTLDHWIQVGQKAHRDEMAAQARELELEQQHLFPTSTSSSLSHLVLNPTAVELGFDLSCLDDLDVDVLLNPLKAFADVLWEQSVQMNKTRRPTLISTSQKGELTLTLLPAKQHVKFSPIQIISNSRRSSCDTDESDWPLTPAPNQETTHVKVAQPPQDRNIKLYIDHFNSDEEDTRSFIYLDPPPPLPTRKATAAFLTSKSEDAFNHFPKPKSFSNKIASVFGRARTKSTSSSNKRPQKISN